MGRVKVVTFGWQCLALLGIALFAMNFVGAQEAKQAVPPAMVPPPLKEPPAPAPAVFRADENLAFAMPMQPAQRLNIVIDPKTPLADLLPPAPRSAAKPANRFHDDLKTVPEVTFQDVLSSKLTSEKSIFEIAHQLTKIRHANLKKTDAFLETLVDHRADLQGMPFAMGEACRTLGARAKFLAAFSAITRRCVAEATEGSLAALNADSFWIAMAKNLQALEEEMVKGTQSLRAQDQDDFEAARVAAVTQVLAPESTAVRVGLVKYLSKVPHVDATRALARMVLFSAEDEIRVAAVQALKLRREKDYAPTLVQGFRYPLPEVAKRAADALVRLGCTDAVPQLVDLLEESDPRFPVTKEVEGKKVALVREVVRVNHHRNCMLCHAPADLDGKVLMMAVPDRVITEVQQVAKQIKVSTPDGKETETTVVESVPVTKKQNGVKASLSAQVPLPNEPLPSLSEGGYGQGSTPDIMVRIDVTYLRQDFSLLMPVHDAAPWPDMQRFDFLVRKRVLSAKEAEEYQQHAPKAVAGSTTPYQRAILFALRELTQRDTAPTPQAWRELLALPPKTSP